MAVDIMLHKISFGKLKSLNLKHDFKWSSLFFLFQALTYKLVVLRTNLQILEVDLLVISIVMNSGNENIWLYKELIKRGYSSI